MGRCGSTSCNFPAAIKLPVKVSEPIITSIAISTISNFVRWGTRT